MDNNTRALVQQVAEEVATRTVERTLISLGIDQSNPIEVQQDMASLREIRKVMDDPEFQQDLLTLREWRISLNNVKSRGMMTLVALVVSGLAAIAWMGFKTVVGK